MCTSDDDDDRENMRSLAPVITKVRSVGEAKDDEGFWRHFLPFCVHLTLPSAAHARRRQVVEKKFTRLCSTKSIATVNGQFPGPTLYAREGDTVLVKVVNHVHYNVTIHW
ncbi:hypothetical protein C4D60_Mb06t34420 [Musa balbisiana]|uniref:Plastocyanin-like domain-containing protein n=1 Tax=Musa balbisiana TaxID=52838 RepID=A0A4S8ITK0_MUSBA|nr:hypothetical protein C4D60_Mb06t34420 [Musa balbisiana]